MFIDINYNKRKKDEKLYLAKPNKQIISPISEKFNANLSIKLANINELTFSIPYEIINENTNKLGKNEHVDTIKEKMLIKFVMGGYSEWFIVDSIEEDADDSDVFNVSAFSLGYELTGKRLGTFETESMNATEVIDVLLTDTIWRVKEIDSMFNQMYRSFSTEADSNVLGAITNWAETFGGILVWDTDNRMISLKDPTENGEFRGMTINYGKLIRSLKKSRNTDEMVTRMWVYGSDDLTISSINPTGQPYIENFDFFMYPFERDANKKVLRSSYYMSNELCNALLDHAEIVKQYTPTIKTKTDKLLEENTLLITQQSKLDELNAELENINELLDTAKAVLATLESESPKPDTTNEQKTVDDLTKQRNDKQAEVNAQQSLVTATEERINVLNSELDVLYGKISKDENFTREILEELNPYIIESTWRDDNYIDAKELYEDGLKKFVEIRQPKVVIDVSIANIMNIIEEQYYWDKLNLGELIKVKYPQMNIEYMAKIIEIDYNFEDGEANIIIANTSDLLNESEKLIQLLYDTSTATKMVENNKYKWNKVKYVSDTMDEFFNSEFDANKQKITAGVRNAIEIGNRGIIIKNPDFPDEVVIMQSGIIALSKDRGETWKTAIKPDGIVAERLVGRIIIGENLFIENNSGLYSIDNSGMSVTRLDEMSRILINTVDGLKIQKKNTDGTWTNKFAVSESGILETDEMIAKRLKLISEKNGEDVLLIDADNGVIYFDNFEKVGTIDGSNVSNLDDDSFADITPSTPSSVSAVGGFKTVTLSWEFSSASYIAKYQVFCSETQGFIPSADNLVYEGSSGGYVHNGEVNKTYYFRVRAVNRKNRGSNYSDEVSASTVELLYEDLGKTISDAIEEAQQASEEAITGVENALAKFREAMDSAEKAQKTADGKNTANYGTATPINPKEGDLWFKPVEGGGYIPLQFENGAWVQKNDKVVLDAIELANQAKTVGEQAKLTGEQAQAKADEVEEIANQAITDSQTAITNANQVVDKANQATRDAQLAIDKAQEGFDKAQEALDISSGISGDVKNALDKAQTSFDTAQSALDGLNGIKDDLVWKLEIHSSNGTTFKNGVINTVLTAKVYKGREDVTSTLTNSNFVWTKTNADGSADVAWNDSKIGVGKSVTITQEDIRSRATFNCQILSD